MTDEKVFLRKYQKEDLHKWAKELNCRGLLAWEPGLGKTYVSIKILKRILQKNMANQVLIIVPATLIPMWHRELSDNGLGDITFVFKPKAKLRKKDPHFPGDNHKIHLISYHMFINTFIDCIDDKFKKYNYDFWILDESHNIKSHKSKVYKFLSNNNNTKNKLLLLSGTPFPQGRIDVFSQINLISPGVLGKNITEFRKKYCMLVNKDFYKYEVLPNYYSHIDKILYKYCCFREADKEEDIPPMTDIYVNYELTDNQANLYKMVKNQKIIRYTCGNNTIELPLTMPAIRMILCQQIASGVVDIEITDPVEKNTHNIKIQIDDCPNEKEKLLIELLYGLPEKKQAIIWINYKETGYRLLKILNDFFGENNNAVINGDVPEKQRELILSEYMAGKKRFLIAHPKTVGTGLNCFSKTQYSFWYECTTDYAVYEQARRRLYRIGQNEKTFEYFLIGEKTIDKYIVEAVKKKKDVMEYIFENYFSEDKNL